MAAPQHQDAVHVAGDLLHAVAHQDNGGTALLVIGPDLGQNGLPTPGVQTRRGLVQDQDLGLHGDDPGDGHPALLSAGELKGGLFQLVLRQAHQGRRFPDPAVDLVPVQAHVAGTVGNVLVHRFLKQLVLRVLEHQPHLEADVPDLLRLRPDVLPMEQDLPRRRPQQAVQMLNQGGFAGAGVADDP